MVSTLGLKSGIGIGIGIENESTSGWAGPQALETSRPGRVGKWKDTIEAVTNEQATRLKSFIRSTLGCGCPDEVLEWIQCTRTELDQEEDTRITRIDVGGQLLVYVLEIEGPDQGAEIVLPAVVAAATVDRATSCFNRLRVVVAIDDPDDMRSKLERCFAGCAPADDNVHLHVVSTMDLPFD